MEKLIKTDEEWKEELTHLQYEILREGGTEKSFESNLLDVKEKGIFYCVACGNELFSSEAKYDSGTGWPSFTESISGKAIVKNENGGNGAEVLCKKCGGHLGHVFLDGPNPTGKRFCINGAVLRFEVFGGY